MKRVTFLLVILIGLLSVGLIYSIRDAMHNDVQIAKQSETLEVQKQMLTLLSGNMKMHYVYSESQLPDMTLLDKDRNAIKLSALLNGEDKVVFKFSSTNCSSCIQHSFSSVRKLMGKLAKDKLIIIADNSNRRELQALVNSLSLSLPVYLTEDTVFHYILEKENVPFFFVIREDLRMKDLFIPMKELPDLSDLYYRIIWKKYFDK